jgi:hypothetical protein
MRFNISAICIQALASAQNITPFRQGDRVTFAGYRYQLLSMYAMPQFLNHPFRIFSAGMFNNKFTGVVDKIYFINKSVNVK